MKKMLPAVSIGVFLFISFAADTLFADEAQIGQDVRKIVSKIVEAHGGSQALGDAAAIHGKGTIAAVMRKDSGTYERWLVRDRKLRVETIYKRSAEYRVLNGRRGFRGTDDTPMAEVTDQRYEAMVYQYKQLEMPYALSRGLFRVTYAGETEIGDRPCIILDVTDEEGPPMKVYADSASFLIARIEGFFSIGERKTDLSAEFDDYREIGGIMLPFRITNYGSGYRIGETAIEKYELNSIMSDSLFMPLGKAGFSK